MAVHCLIDVESLSSPCVKNFEFAEKRFILFVSFCDCNNAVPMPKFEVSHIALNGWSGSGILLDI